MNTHFARIETAIRTGSGGLLLAMVLFVQAFLCQLAKADRLLDLVDIQGIRTNQLIGYGLVVGLEGTGDKSIDFTNQSLKNMLREFGISLTKDVKAKNVAAVSVHADLPAFARPGQKLTITVSSIGDAKSIRGGTLLMTALKGVDREIYAVAQGNVLVGGVSAEGNNGSSVTINHTRVGVIPNGATVERRVETGFAKGPVSMTLKSPSFSTARIIARSINSTLGPGVASAVDAANVQVKAPEDPNQRVTFMALLENMEMEPSLPPARVIFNSRTGTVVMGQNVRVLPAVVSHGNLEITVRETLDTTTGTTFWQGAADKEKLLKDENKTDTYTSDVRIDEKASRAFIIPSSVSLQEIVTAINKVGATPMDLMSILQALESAGALRAELIVM
ncbi:flagellar basal body P-ring protein FlgI [Endozoicomonas sp. Mp262]|uniref:flagellar basal body P-ring protein FlgI n=1 Tax=Endozoicomonas sp. Mp262 TaxID=2919499 RepID=UPI0021D86904